LGSSDGGIMDCAGRRAASSPGCQGLMKKDYPYWGPSRAAVWLLGSVAVLAVLWICGAISTAKVPEDASG
jgi:hypothetical protein